MITPDLPLDPSVPLSGRRPITIVSIILFALTALFYCRAVTFNFVEYDDFHYVVDNVQLPKGLTAATVHWAFTSVFFTNYSPLTILSYLTISTLFGTGPAAFHAANVVLHAATVTMLFLFFIRTGGGIWISAFAAAMWGWHPLRVESVAWVSELKDVLCGLFWVLAMLAHVRYVDRKTILSYLLVLLMYALSLASKPMAVTLPFVLLLLDAYPLRRFARGIAHRARTILLAVVEKLPMLALAGGLSRMTMSAQLNVVQPFPLKIRLENAVIAVADYLRDTLVPRSLSVFYPHPQMIGQPIPLGLVVLSVCLLLAITLTAIILFRRRSPACLIGWLWFLGTLIPVIGLVQVGEQARADRYTYIPTIGLFAGAVWLVSSITWTRSITRFKNPIAVVAVITVCTEVVLMQVQLSYWKNSDTLFGHALNVTSRNYLAYGELANVRMHNHHEAEALELADKSLSIRPNGKYGLVTRALALIHLNRYSDALKALRLSIGVDPKDPILRRHAGNVLFLLTKYDQAEAQFKRALQLDDQDPLTHDDYASLLADRKRFAEARSQWKIAIKLNPAYANAHAGLAQLASQQGDVATAILEYRLAIKYAKPPVSTTWLLNLAWAEATNAESTTEEVDDALARATSAVPDVNRASPLDLDTLSAALARNGLFDQAARVAQQGVRKAVAEGNKQLAASLTERMRGYAEGRPYIAARSSPVR